MTCPLCRKRPAKRACPALRQDICTVCCATKRLVEIHCIDDCRHLEAAQRYPAAVVKRQIDRDVTLLMASVGPLTEQQLQLFFLLQSMVLAYKPEGVIRVVDSDVALATGALASALESASKGVIFEEATASTVAEGLRRAMRPVLAEIAKDGGSRAEREVATVLRAMERGAKNDGGSLAGGETAYLDLVNSVFRHSPSPPRRSGPAASGAEKPLIVLP